MARLLYSAIASIDGFIEDEEGRFDWAEPDEEVFGFVNELERSVGTYLYGRRMYETMVYWESFPVGLSEPPWIRDFTEIWLSAEKVVYSRTLDAARSRRTRIERNFDHEEVRRLKASAGRDLTVAGADLAGQALLAGLVDELQLFVVPVVVGGGKRWLPRSLHLELDLVESRSFASGVVFLRYRPL